MINQSGEGEEERGKEKKGGKKGRGVGWHRFSPVFLPLKHTPLPSQYASTEGNFLQMTLEGRSGSAPKGGSSATGRSCDCPVSIDHPAPPSRFSFFGWGTRPGT